MFSPLAVLLWLVVITPLTAWIAVQKGRSVPEGLVLGFLLGIFGLIIELCLPRKIVPSGPPSGGSS